MLLERFDALATEIKSSQRVRESCVALQIYRIHDNIWYDEQSATITDEQLRLKLQTANRSHGHWREPNSRTAFIKIPQINAVASATFAASPRSPTLQRLSQRIQEACEHATHAFDATHDQLTGLLNGKGYSDSVIASLRSAAMTPATSGQAVAEPAAALSVVLLAIDIDHFKQVNDTYGHLYGDVVLQCLARRLQKCVQELEREPENPASLVVARPSGEEFLVVIQGGLDKEQAIAYAERFRTFVVDQPLPTDLEWKSVPNPDLQKTLTPPPLTNRRVTISVGVASASRPRISEVDQIAGLLRNQADLALYSAKSGGRNTVRHFSDILQMYGRVLQHHPDTGIVVIDIGRQVKVTKGQEFLVFHPDFTGLKPFVYSDGRTSKSLGTYPRYPVGRIIVFDVQQDISFCHVAQNSCTGLLPTGSHLEAIPVGSISHLVANDSMGGFVAAPNLMSAEQLAVLADDDIPFGPKPVTAVFTLADETSLIETRGTAFINEALAKLYESFKKQMPPGTAIGQIQTTEFAVVLRGFNEEEATDLIHKTVAVANELCSGLTKFSAGVFVQPTEGTAEQRPAGDVSELSAEFAIEYARYAALDAKRKGDPVVSFTVRVAQSLMASLRAKKQYTQAIADYKAFRKIGINFGDVENSAALCMWDAGNPDREFFLEVARRATELNPSNPVFHANLGVYLFKFADRLQSYRSFAKALEVAPSWEPYAACVPAMSMSMYAAWKQGEAVDVSRLRLFLSQSKERQGRGSISISPWEIELALRDVDRHIATVPLSF